MRHGRVLRCMYTLKVESLRYAVEQVQRSLSTGCKSDVLQQSSTVDSASRSILTAPYVTIHIQLVRSVQRRDMHCPSIPLASIGYLCRPIYAPILLSLKGYLTASSFLMTIFLFFLVATCSTHTSLVYLLLNSRINLGSHSSLAIPKSLQHRIRAFDLHPSVAVGMPSGSKYCCSPRAIETNLYIAY